MEHILNAEKDLDKQTIDNFYQAIDNPIEMQIFKTSIYNNDIDEAKKRHKKEILNAVVYSMYGERKILAYKNKMYSLSGFVEQAGRLPKINDKIKIIKGRYYFDICHNYILSELWLIINPAL